MAAVRTHAHTINYAVDGPADTPTLLLSGSLGSHLSLWDRALPHLTATRRVVRYDLRGHGGSSTPPGEWTIQDLAGDIAALLDHLGVERADVGGISLGGHTALAFALHHPDRTNRLVVADTGARLGSLESWSERAATVRDAGLEAIVDQVVDGWLTPRYAAAHPEVRAELRANFLRNDPAGYAACSMALAHSDLRQRLREITAPTLAIGGAEDRTTTPAVVRAIADGVPGAAYAEVPGAHLTCVESPAQFAAAVLRHLG